MVFGYNYMVNETITVVFWLLLETFEKSVPST